MFFIQCPFFVEYLGSERGIPHKSRKTFLESPICDLRVHSRLEKVEECLEALTIARCPECGGFMKSDPNMKLMVCTSCGLAVSRSELDRMHDRRLDGQGEESARDAQRRKRHKDYLNWYLGTKDE